MEKVQKDPKTAAEGSIFQPPWHELRLAAWGQASSQAVALQASTSATLQRMSRPRFSHEKMQIGAVQTSTFPRESEDRGCPDLDFLARK